MAVIILAYRRAASKQPRSRRDRLRGRGQGRLQVDACAGPARPDRRRWCDPVDIGIEPANRIGLPSFRTPGVKQQIVEVPHHHALVALARTTTVVAGPLDLEHDRAAEEQAEQIVARETCELPEAPNLLRR